MAYQSFEDLEVWQRGCRLSVDIFRAFEQCRKYSLKDQIERAGLSIPSNVAEGAERGSTKDFAHFQNFSKGSCGELRTQLYIARKWRFSTRANLRSWSPSKEDISNASRPSQSVLAKTRTK